MEIIRIILGVTFLFFSFQVEAQGKFYKTYSDNGHDFGEGIVQLADSSYLITGASSSFGNAPAKAFILHVDKFGNRLWSKSYGGTESNRGRRIFHVENDGIYVAGYQNKMGDGAFDFYFFKTDFSGNLLFEKTYGGTRNEKLYDATFVPSDSSFILVGETKSNPEEVENIFMVRIKSNGDTLWTKQFGTPEVDIARSVTMVNDTTILVVGDYYVTDSLKQKGFLMKMHIDGSQYWFKTAGAKGECSLNHAIVNNGVIRSVGYSRYTEGGFDYSRLLGYVTDLTGLELSENIDLSAEVYSRYGYITGYSIDPNKFYISVQSTIGSAPVFSGGGEDAIIIRGHPGGLFWVGGGVNVSSFGDDQITQLIRTSDGGAVAVGYNSFGGSGGNNITLMKIGENDDFVPAYSNPTEETLVFKEELDASIEVSIYPNPVEEVLQIQVESFEDVHVEILNSFGSTVEKRSFNGLTSIDLSNYASGLYLIRMEIAGQYKTFKILKK